MPRHPPAPTVGAGAKQWLENSLDWLARTYSGTGVAVCTDALAVVAWVNPLAQIKFATPPFRHQCANNPSWQDCECRRWFDPKSGGPCGKGGTAAHHPLCIFDPEAKRRWEEIENSREADVKGLNDRARLPNV